jgi:VanZ family protein
LVTVRTRFLWLAAGFFGAILFGTLAPHPVISALADLTAAPVLVEKLGHVLCFAGLMACLVRAVRGPRSMLLAWTAALLVGAGTEIGQYFAIDRDPSVRDFALDAMGILLGHMSGIFRRRDT